MTKSWDDYQNKKLEEIAEKFGKGSEIYRLHELLIQTDRRLTEALIDRNAARAEGKRVQEIVVRYEVALREIASGEHCSPIACDCINDWVARKALGIPPDGVYETKWRELHEVR